MPKVLLYSNDQAPSLALKEEFIQKIQGRSIDIVDLNGNPDYIISIGGDGTLLSAFHKFKDYLSEIKFIGIHTGHLGFYTDWLSDGLDKLLDTLEEAEPDSVSYPLLEITIDFFDRASLNLLALNEFALRSKSGAAVFDVYLEDFHFETFRGDGICISTPTGSTGLNKSLGGAVIHPKVEAMQMTEIASLNNLVYKTLSSSVIVPKDEFICLKPVDQDHDFNLSVDNQNFEGNHIKKIIAKISHQRIYFSSHKHTHFWDRVESSFIGRNIEERRMNEV